MNTSRFSYEGKSWSPCPTTTGNDGFFHSAFGTRSNRGERYFDGDAKSRRFRWVAFLAHVQDAAMPPPLADVLGKCLSASDGYSYASAEGKRQLAKYVSDIAAAERKVTMEEIPILATLENATIVVLLDRKEETAIIAKPNPDILGGYPTVPRQPKKVVLCLEGDNFSRLEPAGERPKPKSAKNNANKKSDASRYKKGGSAGSKGVEYQVSVLSLVMLKALRNESSQWKLSTENEEAGKFDDVVLESAAGDVLIQCKHKENKNRVTLEELTSTNSRNHDFSLPKYFLSYLLIKGKFKIKNVIICTNADVHEKVLQFLDCPDACSDSLLNYEDGNSSFYTLNDKILPLLRENVKKYFHQSLRNKNIDESEITDENLKDFFKHLQLFFNYPSGSRLAEIIDKLLGLVKYCRDSSDKIFSSEVYSKAMEWFQQKDGVYLAEIHARAMFSEIWRDKYCQELEQYEVTFQENDLNFQGPERVFHVSCEDSCLLQVIKVYRAIQSSKTKTLFVNPDDGLEVRNQAVKIFAMPPYTFLVIILPRTAEKSDVAEMFDELKDLLEKYNYKKVIFVADGNNKLSQQTEWKEIVRFDGCVTFEHLSKESQGRLLKSKSIDFQGKTVSLEELIASQKTEDYTKSLDSRTMERLVRGEKVKVGVPPSGLDNDTARCYISRSFRREIGKKANEGRGNEKTYSFWEESIYDVSDKMILIVDSAGMGKSTVLTRLATTIKEKNPHLWVIKINLNDYTKILKHSLRINKEKISVTELLNFQEATKLRNRLEEFVFSIGAKVVLMLDGVDEISPDYTNLMLDLLSQCRDATNFAKIFVTTRPHLIREMEKVLRVTSFKMLPFTEENQTDFLRRYWMHNLKLKSAVNQKQCQQYADTLIVRMASWVKTDWGISFCAIPLQLRMLAEVFQENTRRDEPVNWEGCKEFLNGDRTKPKLPEKLNIAELYDMFIEKKRDVFVDKGSGNTAANQALVDKFNESLSLHRYLALRVVLDEKQSRLFTSHRPGGKNVISYVLKMGIVQKFDATFQFLHRTFAEYFVAENILKELELENPNVEFQKFLIDELLPRPEFYIVRTFLDNFLQKVLDRLPSNIFENYRKRHDADCVANENVLVVLSKEGCVSILRLILKSINFTAIKRKRTKFRGLFTMTNNKVNTLNYLKLLVQKYGLDIADRQGRTLLQLSSEAGHLDMVKFLIDQGADFNVRDSGGRTVLHVAAKSAKWDAVRYLAKYVVDIDGRDGYGRTPLHLVAERGDVDVIAYLVELGACIDSTDSRGYTVLHLAARSDNWNVVRYLVERDADLGSAGGAVLGLAAASGNWDAVKCLTERGVDVNDRDNGACSVLHSALESNNLEMVRYLVERGVDVNSRNGKYRTVLHLASEKGDLDTIAYLTEHGACVNNRDGGGCTVLHLAAVSGNCEAVMYLVNCGADINSRDGGGRTALHLMAESGNWNAVKYLIESGVDVNSRDNEGYTVLHLAAERGDSDVITYLVRHGALMNENDESDLTALHLAAKRDDLTAFKHLVQLASADIVSRDGTILCSMVDAGKWEAVKHLVEFGADVNASDGEDRTVLHLAVEKGDPNTVEYLVKRGARINSTNGEGRTVLYSAAVAGKWDVVAYLVDNGADVASRSGGRVLRSAVVSGKWDVVKKLVKRGVDVNSANSSGWTVLHSAVEKGDLDIVAYLVENGARVNRKDKYGLTAVHLAAEAGNLCVVRYLGERGGDFKARDNFGSAAIHLAAKKGDLGTIKYLVACGVNVRDRDGGDRTVLHLAGESRNWDAVKYFVQMGVDVNGRDIDDRTVLHSAAEKGDLDTVTYLVECGADINTKDSRGHAVLLVAARSGNWEAVKYLVERGADVNCGGNGTILHLAVERGDLEAVTYLVEREACVNAADDRGCTVLHLAAERGDLDAVTYLVEHGAFVNRRNRYGCTALHLAAKSGNGDAVKYLLERDVDVNGVGGDDRTVLHLVAQKGDLATVGRLVDKGACVNGKDVYGHTALHLVAMTGNWEAVNYLVGRGADVNVRNDVGRTALHYAVAKDHLDAVRFLVRNGADVNRKDNEGWTALHHAVVRGRLDTVEYLVEVGADVNGRDGDGDAPLNLAGWAGNWEVVKYLAQRGAEVGGVGGTKSQGVGEGVSSTGESPNIACCVIQSFIVRRNAVKEMSLGEVMAKFESVLPARLLPPYLVVPPPERESRTSRALDVMEKVIKRLKSGENNEEGSATRSPVYVLGCPGG